MNDNATAALRRLREAIGHAKSCQRMTEPGSELYMDWETEIGNYLTRIDDIRNGREKCN